MRLFIVSKKGEVDWDTTRAMLVRARNENHARELAESRAHSMDKKAWKDPAQTSCEPITAAGPAGILLRDDKNG